MQLYRLAMLLLCCMGCGQIMSQVKIGDNPTVINSASLLELETTDKGFVFPRLSLGSLSSASPLPGTPITGTVVYNTNTGIGAGTGLYMWMGTTWASFTTNAAAGTTDYVTRWTSASSLGTGLIRDNNTSVGINNAPVATEMLTVSGSSTFNGFNATTTKTASGSYAIRGSGVTNVTGQLGYVGSITVAGSTVTNPGGYFTSTVAATPALLATTTGSSTTAALIGLSSVWHGGFFSTNNASAAGGVGTNTVAGGIGLLGSNNTSGSNILGGDGVYGLTGQELGAGVRGENSQSDGVGIIGENTAASGTGIGDGVDGYSSQSQGAGVLGWNFSGSGTGVYGLGNNLSFGVRFIPSAGAGGSFTGTLVGAIGYSRTTSNGTGLVGLGNRSASTTLANGSGGSFIGTSTGIFGYGTTGTSPTGVVGVGNNSATISVLTNGSGGAFTGTNVGSYALATNTTGTGVTGAGNNGAVSTLSGGSGGAFSGTNTGVYAFATDITAGNGIIAVGNNATLSTLANGSGGSFTGVTTGAYGFGSSTTNGTGVVGAGNGVTAQVDVNGSGGAFTGSTDGVLATALSASQGTAAVKTTNTATGGSVYVNYLSDGTLGTAGTVYKIIGVGTVATVVKDVRGNSVALHAPEAPEIYFEDYGEGKLTDGKAHIDIDPCFVKNVSVNEKHPLRVFIQLYGDCKGVFVSNTSRTGFDVTELQGGNSNTPFQWHIVCNRADEVLPNGQTASNADIRFDKVNMMQAAALNSGVSNTVTVREQEVIQLAARSETPVKENNIAVEQKTKEPQKRRKNRTSGTADITNPNTPKP